MKLGRFSIIKIDGVTLTTPESRDFLSHQIRGVVLPDPEDATRSIVRVAPARSLESVREKTKVYTIDATPTEIYNQFALPDDVTVDLGFGENVPMLVSANSLGGEPLNSDGSVTTVLLFTNEIVAPIQARTNYLLPLRDGNPASFTTTVSEIIVRDWETDGTQALTVTDDFDTLIESANMPSGGDAQDRAGGARLIDLVVEQVNGRTLDTAETMLIPVHAIAEPPRGLGSGLGSGTEMIIKSKECEMLTLLVVTENEEQIRIHIEAVGGDAYSSPSS